MNLRRQAKKTMDDVAAASRSVVTGTEWATVALVGVAAVSVLALTLATVALISSRRAHA